MSQKEGREPQRFPGFRAPSYTMVPDELFDELLVILTGAELKVLLYIIRRTFGFKRDADSISLSQMLNGIATRDGRILDRGTGLSKPTLLQALRSLEENGYIIRDQRRSKEKGDEPTVYKLRFVGGEPESVGQKFIPPVVKKFDQGGGQESLPGGWSKNLTTQQTVKQERVKQQHGGGVSRSDEAHISTTRNAVEDQNAELAVPPEGIPKLLHEFGISPDVANELVATYPEEHIIQQYDFTRWLLETHPTQVRDNPAGFLRRAIERGFVPPPDYRTPQQRQQQADRDAEDQRREREALEAAHAAYREAKELARQRLAAATPAQPIPGSTLTTEAAWEQTLVALREQVTGPVFFTYFKPTRLVNCDGTHAVVVAGNAYTAETLTQRHLPRIEQVLGQLLGTRVRCTVVAMDELTDSSEEAEEGRCYAAG
jgi:DNA-binding transcriptional ArsR family regulator